MLSTKPLFLGEHYGKIVESIKNDILRTMRQKGIDISGIEIDFNLVQDIVRVQLSIKQI